MNPFEIKITREPTEIKEAQRLRFQVFNLEMNKGLQSSYRSGLDADEFDMHCDHLIVRHVESQEIVGTYRLLLGSRARETIGFYSEREFDLDRIKQLDDEMLEMGRTCARKDFRDRALIPLMWQTIAQYSREHRVRYLFGCGSLYTTEIGEVSKYFSLLRKNHYSPQQFRVTPVPSMAFEDVDLEYESSDESGLFQGLPSLIKGYLRLGAWVCGPPALDREFGTTDFFLLLDLQRLNGNYLDRVGVNALR